MKDHTTNKHKGVLDFAYISLEEALELTRVLENSQDPVSVKEFAALRGKKKTGWWGLQVASLRRWGLVTEHGKMKLTDFYRSLVGTNDQTKLLQLKQVAFLKIPLFEQIFHKYITEGGIPKEKNLAEVLETEYNISKTYSLYVSKVIKKSIDSYFPTYSNTNYERLAADNPELKIEYSQPFASLQGMEMRIMYPGGSFKITADTKEEFNRLIKTKLDKILKMAQELWEEDDSKKAFSGDKKDGE